MLQGIPEILMWNIKALALTVEKLSARLKFSTCTYVTLQDQGHRVKTVGTHGKVLSWRKLIINIKALALIVQKFKKCVKLQGQGCSVKTVGNHGKVLSQKIFMWNIKALALMVEKL